jgi:hypothetical protein
MFFRFVVSCPHCVLVINWSKQNLINLHFSFLEVLDFELMAFCMWGRCSTTLAMPPALVIWLHFLFRLIWTAVLLFYASHCSWHDRHEWLCPTFFQWIGVSQIILHSWLGVMILLISASQVAKIAGVSHWCHARNLHFNRSTLLIINELILICRC